MPESKHHRKNRSHSEWRKTRNKRRALEQQRRAIERRGMRKAMELMQQQYQSEKEIMEGGEK
tara:strand:- start:43 stop:228 length:186 start_codon:yes stop_codon:yes gene_type:complete